MTILLFDRVFVSCVGEHGRVSEIIPTGIAGILKYRVEFGYGAGHRSGIYGAAFCQPAPMPLGRAMLRLVTVDGQEVCA
jgi:hypothetical protein